MSVNPTLIQWLFSSLTGRTQQVQVGKATSCARTANTGTPQGCVLSPALLTRYTADCRSNSDANLLIKFADDTSLTGLVEQDEAAYRGRVQELAEWCDSNFLELNVSKTKELIVNFRAAPTHTEPITIKGQSVEMVSAYRYLGTIIDNKLPWTPPHWCLLQENTKENVPPAEVANFQSRSGDYTAVLPGHYRECHIFQSHIFL